MYHPHTTKKNPYDKLIPIPILPMKHNKAPEEGNDMESETTGIEPVENKKNKQTKTKTKQKKGEKKQ